MASTLARLRATDCATIACAPPRSLSYSPAGRDSTAAGPDVPNVRGAGEPTVCRYETVVSSMRQGPLVAPTIMGMAFASGPYGYPTSLLCGVEGDRTLCLVSARRALYQLSYNPMRPLCQVLRFGLRTVASNLGREVLNLPSIVWRFHFAEARAPLISTWSTGCSGTAPDGSWACSHAGPGYGQPWDSLTIWSRKRTRPKNGGRPIPALGWTRTSNRQLFGHERSCPTGRRSTN